GAWAGAVAWAWAWVWAVAVAVAWPYDNTSIFDRWKNIDWFAPFLFCVFPGLVGGITFSLMSGNVIEGIVTGIGSIVIVFTLVITVFELEKKNFSPVNIFLILAVTNLSGLGSGWLLGFLLHPKG
ncbi:MAG: serine/threonine protein kinase, partial [Microcystis sp.]